MHTLRPSLEEKLAALRQCSYFATLDEGLLAALAEGTRLLRFERGEVLFWQDEPSAGLHMLRRGLVKLFKVSTQGREQIVNIFEEGATFGEVPTFDAGVNPVNVAALEDSEVWVIDAQIIRSLMSEHPEMCHAVVLNLARNLRMLVGVIEQLSFYQVTHRLARLLAQLSPEQLGGETSARLTQDQLAARLGTVREVAARSLRQLERIGAIRLRRRQIEIVDRAALEEWAQGPG